MASRPAPARKAISSATTARPGAASPGSARRIAPGVNLGFSVDQSRTSIDVPLAMQSATLDLTQFGFNASVDKGPWTWAVALVHGFGKVDSSRDTGSGTANADYQRADRWRAHRAQLLLEYRIKAASCRKPRSNMCVHSTGSFQEVGGLDPLTASGATVERSRLLLGAEIGHYWIFDQKIFDLSAYGKFVDNTSTELQFDRRQSRH